MLATLVTDEIFIVRGQQYRSWAPPSYSAILVDVIGAPFVTFFKQFAANGIHGDSTFSDIQITPPNKVL